MPSIEGVQSPHKRDLLQDHLVSAPGQKQLHEHMFYRQDVGRWIYNCASPFTAVVVPEGHFAFVVQPRDSVGNVGDAVVVDTFRSSGAGGKGLYGGYGGYGGLLGRQVVELELDGGCRMM